MIPTQALKYIKRIQVKTSRLVTEAFSGQYHSVFKGRGMEFDEVRTYQPGDDIRLIDWNVTARMGGEPFIKKFVEERELTLMFLLDLSQSLSFATVNQLKRNLAAEICSVLAFSAIKNNDKVGLITFTDKIEKFIPPAKGLKHVLLLIREAIYFKSDGRGTNISLAIEYLTQVIKRKTIVFIISDFFANDYEKPLSIANKRHDIIAVTITDPAELSLPDVGIVEFIDPESGNGFLVDSSSAAFKKEYKERSLQKMQKRTKSFLATKVDHIEVFTDRPYIHTIIKFFKMRQRRALR
ncbi:MAG: DUF58 domain-containing protein [Candidatus Magnetoovum sp. WYHC-5]|nr:DUF58 domain-containing protein [Candidatus Magnetoovum sp. WYHC-5]